MLNDIYEFLRNNKKLVIIASIIIIAGVFLITYRNNNQATLDILVSPNNSEIKLNGNKVKNITKINIDPGKYKVQISADKHESKEFELHITPRQEATLYQTLKPTTELPKKDKQINQIISDGAISRQYSDDWDKLAAKYPIMRRIPLIDTDKRSRFKILPEIHGDDFKVQLLINDGCNKSLFEIYQNSAFQKLDELEKGARNNYKIEVVSKCKK